MKSIALVTDGQVMEKYRSQLREMLVGVSQRLEMAVESMYKMYSVALITNIGCNREGGIENYQSQLWEMLVGLSQRLDMAVESMYSVG